MSAEIFENRLLKESPLVVLGHMQVRIDEAAPDQDSQVTYLYKLGTTALSRYFANPY